ncbi:serine/threonine protein kinase [Paenibacillus sp. WQ 127069]|uniref:Serine/threonine protein kinase n=1 Tax=Paenibacillus baimaensis TaxID=2982185 RepID=A0ABT2UNJ6_9BACL|nr:serine/threonine-protein kinase [Paenibacillus sp. WQ 127069]MCU6796220.1 serine/threonine protein kinase [Paenibacillus sp. WQ 127069]
MQPQGKQIGDVVEGRYRIVAVLGSGGMSTVYLADDLRLAGKRWAVKESRQSNGTEYEFLAEAEMLVKLNHPNLPDIVDYFPADSNGCSYLVMDYIEGETLLQRFERSGKRLPVNHVIDYALQLCDVFAYLHSHQPEPIIYRDVKPANLMIDAQERIRLIDFGIARSYKAGQAADTVRIGTIGFAAPEQFEGRQTDARTDLFGLGALLYYLLSGGHYYYAVRRPLSDHSAAISASLSVLVEKLLHAEPRARCQSAAEVRDELLRIQPLQIAAGNNGADVYGEIDEDGGRGRNRDGGRAEQGGTASRDSGGKGLSKSPPRVLVVAGLYAGAGATFTTLALARALHGLGVRHAVMEVQSRHPELYTLLYGEKHAPPDYRCYNEAGVDLRQQQTAWEDGNTLWLPAAPQSGAEWPHDSMSIDHPIQPNLADGNRTELAFSRLQQLILQEIERPLILVDIGSNWEDETANELIKLASEFVYVMDPMLHKLESAAARRNMKRLKELRRLGKPVWGIANKAVNSSHTGQWLSVFPEPPVCMLPAIDFTRMAEASWLGILVQDRPGVRAQLERSMQDWLRSWLPHTGPKGLLHKLWRNG